MLLCSYFLAFVHNICVCVCVCGGGGGGGGGGRQHAIVKANFGVVGNEIFRCNPETIAQPLCLMFNNILQSKVFSNAWNLSLIKPLHKSGTFSKHDNYRGMCISNHLS